jgi:2-dehydropantoate 2-reductase
MPTSSDAKANPEPKRVAVMGAGAVGSYFGGMLARAGVPVTMIARGAYVEAVRRNKLFLDTVTFQERVAVEVSSEPSAVRDAHVVLFCVKGQDNEEAARACAASCGRCDCGEPAERRGQCGADSRRRGD